MNSVLRPSAVAVLAFVAALSGCAGESPVAPARLPETALLNRHTRSCLPDSKLIGLIEISAEDRPGTWWYITRLGMDKVGLTDYKATIEGYFQKSYSTLDEAIADLLVPVRVADVNGNGLVCTYEMRGTRMSYRDPYFNELYFNALDDYLD